MGGGATSPLHSGAPPKKGTKSMVAHNRAKCYITPAFSGVPKKNYKGKGGPQVGGGATSPLRSRGSPKNETKSMVAHKWAEVLHHPCVSGGPQTREQNQWWPTGGRKCYITPAFPGVPKQDDKGKGGPQVGGGATSPLCSRGSPSKGTKSMVAHKWAELLHHPCVLGGTQTRGQSQRWPTSGRKCYITLCVLGGPQTRRQSQTWPTSGRRCYITPAFSGVPKQRDKVNGGPQVGGSATSPLRFRGSPNKGTKSMVAHRWAEVLHHPCVPGGPQTRRQRQRWPTSGRRCYITPVFSGVPKQGDKVNGGPQVGGTATSPLRSRGYPNTGTKSKVAHKWAEVLHHPLRSRGSPNKTTKSNVAHKWAEVLHHPCVLGGPQTRGQS